MSKIILCGYMASGKTTVARLLAKASGLTVIDLDELIEKQENKSITEIFKEGEIKFRKLEHKALNEIVENNDNFILSLGGGTPCYGDNYKVLHREDVTSVYLKTSIQEIVKRIILQGTERPLLNNVGDDELEEYVAKHLFDRSYYYMQAKYKIVTDDKTIEEVVNEIISLL